MTAPLVLCVDNSGSMVGGATKWTRRLAEILLERCFNAKRTLHVLHYDTQVVDSHTYVTGRGDLWWPPYCNGGTAYDIVLNEALKLAAPGGHIMFVTDGAAPISDVWTVPLKKACERAGVAIDSWVLDTGFEHTAGLSPKLLAFSRNSFVVPLDSDPTAIANKAQEAITVTTPTTPVSTKPLTATQQRNLERILNEDCHQLHREVHERFDLNATFTRQAKEEWFADHPEYVALLKKAERIAATTNKKVVALLDELEAQGYRRPEASVTLGHYLPPRIVVPGRFGSGDRIVDAWTPREEELRAEHSKKRETAVQAINDFQNKRQREILLATLGEAGVLSTTPSLDEIIDTFAPEA